MFTLRNHARRGARIVALGAVASAACVSSVAQAVNLTWDPGLTPATPSGGSGTFDNAVSNFSDGVNDVSPTAADDVAFGAPGGNVTVAAGGASVQSLTINADGYVFSGGNITLNGLANDNVTVLSLTSGNATLGDVENKGEDFLLTHNVNVSGTSILTVNNFTNASYGTYSNLRKTGTGTLKVTGTLDVSWAHNQLFVDEGEVQIAGLDNGVSAGLAVQSGATLSGDAHVTLGFILKDPGTRRDLGLQTFTVKAGGNLSPGANTSGQFGAVGKFGTQSGYNNYITFEGRLEANSTLNLDIESDTSYDSLELTAGSYAESRFIIEKGAKVNINAINPLIPGTYNILTGIQFAPNNSGMLMTISGGGFEIGAAPEGFEYDFQDVLTINGIGSRATAVNLVVSTPTTGSTWTPADSTWSTSTNWVGGDAPDAAGTTATFNGNTSAAVNVDAAKTVGRMILSGADYTFSGSAITLDNNGGNGANALIRSTSNSHTFNNPVNASGTDLDIQARGGSSLNFAGGIDNSLGRTVTLGEGNITIDGFNNGNINSILHSKADATVTNLSGADGRVIVSAGVLTLTGTNTYSGGTHLNGGTLSISSLDNIGTSTLTFRGGMLRITGTTLDNINGRIANAGEFIGFSGGFDIADPNHTFTVSDSLSSFGGGSLTKTGPGTLVLSGFNALKGNYRVQQGIMRITGTTAGGYNAIILDGGTLGGTGTISTAIIPGAGPHTIHPSAGLPAGTASSLIVFNRLHTNSDTTLKFNLVSPGAAGVGDKIIVNAPDRLNLNGGTVAVGSTATGPGSLGYYKVIQYLGTIQGAGADSLVMGTPAPGGKIRYFLDATHDAGWIDIHRGFEGDADDNGTVEFVDFVALANNYLKPNTNWHTGDFDNSGTTDFLDFVILANNYAQIIGGGSIVASADELAALQAFAAAAAPVPEPATLTILSVGIAALMKRRRK